MKKETIFFVLFFFLLFLPLINADSIPPGYTPISVRNYIANLADFPDFVFLSGGGINFQMCPLEVIQEERGIGHYYKFCSLSVYAIPKENFNLEKMEEINSNYSQIMGEEYIKSINGKKIIEHIKVDEAVPITSTKREEINYYSIDLDKLKSSPDKVVVKRNYLVYFYFLIPLIAIIAIFLIIRKRNTKKKKI